MCLNLVLNMEMELLMGYLRDNSRQFDICLELGKEVWVK